MNWNADHIGFVIAAYVISFVMLGGLVTMIIRRDRKLRAILKSKSTDL